MTEDEIKAQYRIYKMGENERIESVDCGDTDLNDFILNDAVLYRKEKLAVTYAYIDKDDNTKVAAFFCLSNDRISLADFDNKTKYNKFSRRFNTSIILLQIIRRVAVLLPLMPMPLPFLSTSKMVLSLLMMMT